MARAIMMRAAVEMTIMVRAAVEMTRGHLGDASVGMTKDHLGEGFCANDQGPSW